MESRTPHCVYAALTERFELRLSELNPQVGKVTYQLADLYSWLDHMVGFCINFVMLQAMCHCYRSAVAWGGMCSCSVQRSDAKAKQLCNVRAPKSWPVCAGPGFPAGEPAGGRHIRAARPQLDQGADRVSAAERGRPMRAGAALAEGNDGGLVVARRRMNEQREREILPGPDWTRRQQAVDGQPAVLCSLGPEVSRAPRIAKDSRESSRNGIRTQKPNKP